MNENITPMREELLTSASKQPFEETIRKDLLLIDEAQKLSLHLLLTHAQRHLFLTLESKLLQDDPTMTNELLQQKLAQELAKLSGAHDLSTVLPW